MGTLVTNACIVDTLKTVSNLYVIRETQDMLIADLDTIARNVSANSSLEGVLSIWDKIDIPVLVSVVIFFLGFYITEVIRKHHKRNELILYKSIILDGWRKSKNSLDTYINSLSNFVEAIKNNDDLNIAQWESNAIHTAKLNTLPIEKVAETIVENLDSKDKEESLTQMMNLLFQLEYIDKASSEIRATYDKYCFENQKVLDEWNIHYVNLIESINDLSRNTMLDQSEILMVKQIQALLYPKLKEKPGTVVVSEWDKDFINPALEYLIQINLDSSIYYTILRLIKPLKVVVIKHNAVNNFNAIFNVYVENLRKAEEIIEKSIKYINDHNIKKVHYIK